MATLTSEAEFERLYQLFIQRGGGYPTLLSDQFNTPAEYYKELESTNLSPSELAALQAKQAQYNRQAALNTISNEIADNTFNNPYDSRSNLAIASLNAIAASPITITDFSSLGPTITATENSIGAPISILGSLADISELPINLPIGVSAPGDAYFVNGDLWVWDGQTWNNISGPSVTGGTGNAINTTSYSELSKIKDMLSILSDPAFGGSAVVAGLVFAGIAELTGVDLEKLILGAGLLTAGTSMFSDLQSHTNEQTADLPGKMNEIDQLTGLQKSFGELSSDSCSIWNELMGILSGAFDGVLDFIEGGIEKFKDFMNSTAIGQFFNQISSAIGTVMAGITGSIAAIVDQLVSSISAALAPILSQIDSVLGPLKDIMNDIGNLVEGVLGGIEDMAGQIANEVAGLASMAADIAAKMQALAMAAMMLDPCKLAVLLNTGSPELKNAAGLLNMPTDTVQPSVNIPTETDTRANPEEVQNAVSTANAKTSTMPGVPQNPIGSLASLYQPFNAYLHDLVGSFDGIFGGAFEAIDAIGGGSIVSSIGSTLGNNPITSSLSNITSSLQGTIGDIASNLGALATGMPLGVNQYSENVTGSVDADNSDFSSGGAVAALSQNNSDVTRTAAEKTSTTKVVTENTKEGVVTTLVGQSTQIAAVRTEWKKEYQVAYTQIIRDANKISREINDYLSNAKFRNTEQKQQAKLLYNEAIKLKEDTREFQTTQLDNFTYTSKTQYRDEQQELKIAEYYTNVVSVQNKSMLSRFQNTLTTLTQSWNSIKAQAILPGSSNNLG